MKVKFCFSLFLLSENDGCEFRGDPKLLHQQWICGASLTGELVWRSLGDSLCPHLNTALLPPEVKVNRTSQCLSPGNQLQHTEKTAGFTSQITPRHTLRLVTNLKLG